MTDPTDGYCNSAANPFIYGLCSKDFRYAFQKFLRCRYKRTKPALRHSANTQMMTMTTVDVGPWSFHVLWEHTGQSPSISP